MSGQAMAHCSHAANETAGRMQHINNRKRSKDGQRPQLQRRRLRQFESSRLGNQQLLGLMMGAMLRAVDQRP